MHHLIDWEEARVLDLFAGTGAMGIEALSRGAAFVDFVDNASAAVRACAENLKSLSVSDERFATHKADALDFAAKNVTRYQLVFIDPPYALHALNPILHYLCAGTSLEQDSIVVAEHGFAEHVMSGSNFEVLKSKSYGETQVEILRKL